MTEPPKRVYIQIDHLGLASPFWGHSPVGPDNWVYVSKQEHERVVKKLDDDIAELQHYEDHHIKDREKLEQRIRELEEKLELATDWASSAPHDHGCKARYERGAKCGCGRDEAMAKLH